MPGQNKDYIIKKIERILKKEPKKSDSERSLTRLEEAEAAQKDRMSRQKVRVIMKDFTAFISTESLFPLATSIKKIVYEFSPPVKYTLINENFSYKKHPHTENLTYVEGEITTTKEDKRRINTEFSFNRRSSPTKSTAFRKMEKVEGRNKTITVDEYESLMSLVTAKRTDQRKKSAYTAFFLII